jgi:6-phosphogluconolactonase
VQRVYITLQGDDKIAIYNLDSEDSGSGALSHQEDIAIAGGPAPFTLSPDGNHAYTGLRTANRMLSFDVDSSTGSLTQSGSVDLESDPCYVSVDATSRHLLSAYYFAGHVAVHPISPGGALGEPATEWLATRPKAHYAHPDASNSYMFLPHVGESNAIFQFKFDSSTGTLNPNDPPVIETPEGDGPRHYAYHPAANFVYFNNEQGSSVTAYQFDPDSGTLSPFQTVSTLPDGWSDNNSCAQLHMTSSGDFLYSSNRGHNSIAMFAVNPASGELTSLGQQLTVGTPRAFCIDPLGNFMLVGGLDDGDLATYRIDKASGRLQHIDTRPVGDQPMWIHITDPVD